jgi:alpha-methylacyl-CoA racemase
VIEGLRPGVMERLGLGPEVMLERNPRLVYGRMTGWGQTGPLAQVAGHDLNYIALSGALAAIGSSGAPPPPPLNLIGDFGGGSMFLVTGILAALLERARSGRGQVVDAAIVDGVNAMMAMFAGLVPAGHVSMDRDLNMLGGAAPFYRCYTCADGRYVSVGAIEPKFYGELLERLGLPAELAREQMVVDRWPETTRRFDTCFAPVLELDEVPAHGHMAGRGEIVGGVWQAAPAPRLSRTPGRIAPSTDGAARLVDWGIG